MNREEIIDLADKLYINLTEDEIEYLLKEFDYISTSAELISKIEGIESISPMHVIPYKDSVKLRSDEVVSTITKEDVLKNSKDTLEDSIKVPKVVE